MKFSIHKTRYFQRASFLPLLIPTTRLFKPWRTLMVFAWNCLKGLYIFFFFFSFCLFIFFFFFFFFLSFAFSFASLLCGFRSGGGGMSCDCKWGVDVDDWVLAL